MTASNFERVLPLVLKHEGGWADDPDDPGGATMRGITIATYAAYRGRPVTKAELRAITDREIAEIYRRRYWDVVRADELPSGLDYAVFDAAVNSGSARAARWLQAAVGATADGKVGPQTLAAAKVAPPQGAIDRLCDGRLAFMRALKTWPKFGRGWARRVADVRAEAMRLSNAGGTAPLPPTKPTPTTGGLWALIVAFFAALFRRS